MLPTLFYIPEKLAGIPMFGIGLLLFAWIGLSVILLFHQIKAQGWNGETLSQAGMSLLFAGVIAKILPAVAEPGLGLPIRGYGVMLIIAISASLYLAVKRGQIMGLPQETLFELAFWIFPAGIVGGRVFYVIEYWQEVYSKLPPQRLWFDVLNFTGGGLVIYGALFGSAAAFLAFCWFKRLPTLAVADLIAPSLALGQSLGRVGCFLSGCCYGGTTDSSWAVTFPWESAAAQRQLEQGALPLHGLLLADGGNGSKVLITGVQPGSAADRAQLVVNDALLAVNGVHVTNADHARQLLTAAYRDNSGATSRVPTFTLLLANQGMKTLDVERPPRSLPVHPTQIYSAIDAMLLCALLWLWHPFRRRDGECLLLLLTLHPITRFLLEIIRVDEVGFWGSSLSISQHISLALLGAAVCGWALLFSFTKPGVCFPLQKG